jgi:pimeloyl-ACP methyl ester carboxylesterase
VTVSRRLLLPLLLLAAAVAGCDGRPLLPFSLDTVPVILAPASSAGVVDLRGRFREIYCAIRAHHGTTLPEDRPCEDVVLRLADEPRPSGAPVALGAPRAPIRVVMIPGIFNECFIKRWSPFADARPHLETHGYRTDIIHVSGMGSSEQNAEQIRKALDERPPAPGERIVLVGHSKGTSDALEALAAFPGVASKVTALVSVAGVVAGSPIADRLGDAYQPLLRALDLPPCGEGDTQALVSLRRSTRLASLARSPPPKSVKYFSLGGIVQSGETSSILRPFHKMLASVDPRNDGQMVFTDTVIPGGHLLGFMRGDHWAIALPFSRKSPALAATVVQHNAFPREVLLEAIVRTVEEAL